MAQNTTISWATHTMNFFMGCTAVSAACDFCYAEAQDKRFGFASSWGPRGERRRTSAGNWKRPLIWDRIAYERGRRDRVFSLSMGDFFDNRVPVDWREEAWDVIGECQYLDWLILTKRPQNIAKMLPSDWGDGWPNVWLGVTAENQEESDRRIPILRDTPAALRFLSCEPLLGRLDLRQYLAGIDWVICGGESGPHARPMDLQWAEDLRAQCAEAGVPFHMKQVCDTRGRPTPIETWPESLRVRQNPKSPASATRAAA